MVERPMRREQVEELAAEADIGGRRPAGATAWLVAAVAVAWSLFQLWYASPLPFMLGFGVFGDTEARAFHLSFALFLAFASFPAFQTSPRDRVPIVDWALAAAAIACVLYLVVFYRELVQRPGLPTFADIAVSVVGVLLLIEASRRAEGPWMPDHLVLDAGVRVPGPLPARPPRPQGLIARPRRLAFLAHVGGRVRRGARRLHHLHLPVRAVRRAAGEGRCRQLLHPGCLLAARQVPRRAGQGRRRLLRHDRHDLGLVGGQRGDDRRVHDPAHEARRLHADPGRRHRVRRRRQRPADAAGDGGRRLHHGRVRRHHLRRCGAARDPARALDLRRPLLRRRSGSREGRHDRYSPAAAAHFGGGARQGGHHHLFDRHPECRHLLGSRLDEGGVRRGCELGRHRLCRRCLHRPGRQPRALPRSRPGRSEHAGDRGARLLRDGAHRHPLPAAGLGADLVPDGGGDVAGPCGLLGRGGDGRRRY